MRVRLSIRAADGEHDVELVSDHPVPLAEVRDALVGAGSIAHRDLALYREDVLLADDEALGSQRLCSGAVLTTTPVPSSPGKGVLRLDVTGGPDSGASHQLERGRKLLGRGEECAIVIKDEEISRRHLVLEVAAHAVTVQDLGSTNGSFLDGQAIAVGHPHPLTAGQHVRVGRSQFALVEGGPPPAVIDPAPDGTKLVHRPARPAPTWLPGTVVRPDPPAEPARGRPSWLTAVVPALGSLLLAILLHSAQLLAFTALAPLTMGASMVAERRSTGRQHRDQLAAYQRSIAAAENEVAQLLKQEQQSCDRRWPDPAALLLTADEPNCRLWERHRSDAHFLTVRVGLADQPARTSTRQGPELGSAATLPDLPAVLDLRRHAVGLAGPRRMLGGSCGWLVGQLLVHHPPSDLQLTLLVDHAQSRQWRWLRWAEAHVATLAATPAQREQALAQLLRCLDDRVAISPATGGWSGPWQVVLIDAEDVATLNPRFDELIRNGRQVGIAAICVSEDDRRLPRPCTATVQLHEGSEPAVLRTDDQQPLLMTPDQVGPAWPEQVARALAPLRELSRRQALIAAAPPLSKINDLDCADPDSIRRRWQRTTSAAAAVGVSNTSSFVVDLVRDGPHILIAGTTGSGKSELLRSLVAALAGSQPPDRLSFVLIDYKGGAAFAECAALPHVLGMVTDLDAAQTVRALTSLEAELRRRERAFSEAGVTDLPAYWAASSPARIPLSRLVLVIDEFAGLAEELPDFLSGLLSIAQRGRSLGVHLVLATQRPAGVLSADIKANMSLRIALRVTDPAESIDVIGTDVACRISRDTPGRAFARYAAGDLVEFQTSLATLPAVPEVGVRAYRLDEWNEPRALLELAPQESELSLLQKAVSKAASSIDLPPRPWLAPLPAVLAVEPRLGSTQLAIGVLDQPARQSQVPLSLELSVGDVVGVIGRSRSGRSSMLRTTALLAASQLSADRVHLYVLDCAGGGLRRLEGLPHCGTYATLAEPGKLERLVHRLAAEIEHRRDWGDRDRGASSSVGPGEVPPAVVLLDGWEQFCAHSDELDGGRLTDAFLRIATDGRSVGMTTVISGGRALLGVRSSSVLSRRLVLGLNDPADYVLAGVPKAALDAAGPGGGFDPELEASFQLGLLDHDHTPAGQWLAGHRSVLHHQAELAPPRIRIRDLPERVQLSELAGSSGGLIVGIGGDDRALIECDFLESERQFLIAGPAGSGRSTALMGIAEQCWQRGLEFTLAGSSRSPLAAWARSRELNFLSPASPAAGAIARLLLLDDAEQFLDTPLGERFLAEVSADELPAVVAARSEDLLIAFRGVAVQVRRRRTGLLLQPNPVDGELLGVRISGSRPAGPPGRGLLVSQRHRTPPAGLPIQVATP